MIRVVVADDQDLVRAGFVLLLQSSPDVEVVGEARDGLEAVAVCRRTAPQVVLMDVRMPHLDGLAATRTILADPACAQTKVLVLTTFDDDLVLEAPVGGERFRLKETRPDQLLEAIQVVADGEALWRSIGLGRAGLRSWGWAFGFPILLCGGAVGTALLVGAGHLRALDVTGPRSAALPPSRRSSFSRC